MKNGGSCCVGQVPQTSHAVTRPKKHVSDASVTRCRGLLQQAPPPVCSRLVVDGVLDVIRTRYLYTRTCSSTTLYVQFFFFSAAAGSSQKILEDCLMLLVAAVFFYYFVIFRVSPPKCMR